MAVLAMLSGSPSRPTKPTLSKRPELAALLQGRAIDSKERQITDAGNEAHCREDDPAVEDFFFQQ